MHVKGSGDTNAEWLSSNARIRKAGPMTARSVTTGTQASSCYFRTTTDGHHRKALVQIDERCNLHCAHCFVSATRHGPTMLYEQITSVLIPRLAECRLEQVNLTGVEPT